MGLLPVRGAPGEIAMTPADGAAGRTAAAYAEGEPE
jgi:hypothetical protein